MSTLLSRILLLANLCLAATTDRIDLCGTQAYTNGYNSSGSVTVPGFQVNESYPETDWTWTRYVTDEKVEGTNDSALWQTFGLETSPQLNLSDPTLPYTGCIIVPRSVMVAGRADDGTCSGIFNSGCISEIISKVNNSASMFSGTQRGSSAVFSCPQLIQSITTSSSSKCADQWHGSISTEFLPNDFSTTGMSSRRCVPKNETGHPFFGWAKEANSQTDYRDYDQAIRTPHPVIVAVWLKATDGELDDPKHDQKGWADTRLFCIPANNTRSGSRTLANANRSAHGAAVGNYEIKATSVFLGLVIALGFGMGL